MKLWFAFMVLGVLVAGSIYGQVTSGAILGTVVDPSGAQILNGRVTARNLETNATQTTDTSNGGHFRFPQLRVGSY